MYKEDLALNNPQWLICHKNQQNVFGCFHLAFAKHKFLNSPMLHVYLCSFQIIHEVKQCTCQCTTFHNTTNYNQYFPQLEVLLLCDKYTAN